MKDLILKPGDKLRIIERPAIFSEMACSVGDVIEYLGNGIFWVVSVDRTTCYEQGWSGTEYRNQTYSTCFVKVRRNTKTTAERLGLVEAPNV